MKKFSDLGNLITDLKRPANDGENGLNLVGFMNKLRALRLLDLIGKRFSRSSSALVRRKRRWYQRIDSLQVQMLEQRLVMSVDLGNARPYWGNGHYYAFTKEDNDWKDAYDRSRSAYLSQLDTYGYLATITSSGENSFIYNYSYDGKKIPKDGYIAGTDSTDRDSSEGNWLWRTGPNRPENGVVFRTGGKDKAYTNWYTGEPNNDGNQDYLKLGVNGYWYDRKPDQGDDGYITEWGREGVEFNAGFAELGSSSTVNGQENGQVAKMTISFDRKVPSDYVDIRDNTPLIDIPISFTGTATEGTDYEMSVSGGNSYFRDGRLYVRNTQTVTLTFTAKNNNSWQGPRTIKATLESDGSENIYGISGNATSQVWIYDDEPLLSLGQGAYQFIRAPFTVGSTQSLPTNNSDFNTSADTLIFDTDGINESDSSLSDNGFYDSFAMRWETYVRIPETGIYTFYASSDDGHALTVRRNNKDGSTLGTVSNWSDGYKSGNTSAMSLTKGDVVWLRFDTYEKSGTASARLLWDRPDGNGGVTNNEVIPSTAMFLSESLARGLDRTESSGQDTTSLGFQLFANKDVTGDLAVKLSSTSETSSSTVNKTLAQRRTGSTKVGDDYAIFSGSSQITSDTIGLNDNYGTLIWRPNKSAGSLENVQSFDLLVLTDSYAEAIESVTLTLGGNSGYGVSNASQTVRIYDNPFVLSVTAGQSPQEGASDGEDVGWFTVSTNGHTVPSGLRLRYSIVGGTASRDVDYTAPKATLSTTSYSAEDLVVFPTGVTETKIYIAALADAIREGDETVTLELITNVETDDKGFQFQRYNVDTRNNQATLAIRDSSLYPAAIVSSPADRIGTGTVRAQQQSGQQIASFDVRLSSQPRATLTISLSATSGTLSAGQLTFTAENWNSPQRVILTGQQTDEATTVLLQGHSADSFYSGVSTQQRIVPSAWPSELELNLWEGGTEVPLQPTASVQAVDDEEGASSRFGFDLILGSPAAGTPVELLYVLNAGDGFTLDGTSADARHEPDRTYRPLEISNLTDSSGGRGFASLGSLTTVSTQGEFSAEAWVRLDRDTNATNGGVLNFSNRGTDGILLGFRNNKPALEIRDSSGKLILQILGINEVASSEWNHLAFSVNASNIASLYLNGELVGRQLLPAQLSQINRTHNYIGRSFPSDSPAYLTAAVRGVAIWNVDRSQDAIRASMLSETASGDGLISGLSLNNSLANAVAGAPDATLSSGSVNQANFATKPIYSLFVPAGEFRVGVPLTIRDDLVAEGYETLTVSLVDTGRYSLGGSSSAGTAELTDNDIAGVDFLAEWSNLNSTSSGWTDTSQFRISEADSSQGTLTRIGLRLTSQPADQIVLVPLLTEGLKSDIELTSQSGAKGSQIELVFNPENWDQIQEIQLKVLDDKVIDGDVIRQLNFRVSTNDNAYKNLSPGVSLLILDDDTFTAGQDLEAGQNASAPFATISAPTIATLLESGVDSAVFTVSLSAPATQDTLVFFDLEHSNRQLYAGDFSVVASQNTQTLSGLARFDATGSEAETASVDSDGINETKSGFTANGQVGSFTTTWSGYIAIPESGSYSFSVPVQGGIRLRLDGMTVIDQMIDTVATWTTESLQLSRGDFVAVTLDYQSFGTYDPRVALFWERPRNNNATSISQIVPAEAMSRVDGIHLLFEKGSNSATVNVSGIDDSIDENDELLFVEMLSARGVELVIKGQTTAIDGNTQLQISLGTTDRETVTLEAGTVLALGEQADSSGNRTSTVAEFTILNPVTLHRDRIAETIGSLIWVDEIKKSELAGSVVNLVASSENNLYQVLDRGVTLTLAAPLNADAAAGDHHYLASFKLEDTNRSSVTLDAGTELLYRTEASDRSVTLVLVSSLTLQSGQTANSIAVTTKDVSLDLDLTTPDSPLVGLGSRVDFPTDAMLTILDDDVAGLLFFLDADATQSASGSAVSLVEQGSSLNRFVRLKSQPSDSVTVYLETDDTTEVRLQIPGSDSEPPSARIALTFTPENWDVAQAFQLVPVDDSLDDGDQNVAIHARTTSSDPFYEITSAGTSPLVKVNFQKSESEIPDGYLEDSGQLYADRSNGWSYGWSTDQTSLGNDRNVNADQRLDTNMPILSGQFWELDIANGVYEVSVSVGDAYSASISTVNVEGLAYFAQRSLAANEFAFHRAIVRVSDGRLTLDSGTDANSQTQINYIEINRQDAPTLIIRDDDSAGLKLELQQSSITRAGNGFINLTLSAQPTADVVVRLMPGDHQFTINDRSVGRPETMTFTPDDWFVPQTVGLYAVDDEAVEDITTSRLDFATMSSDSRFNALSVDPVTIVISDNDLPTASLEFLSNANEQGLPGRFRISLSDPTASSAGSGGLVIGYEVTTVDLDSSLIYGSDVGSRLERIAQTPASVVGSVRIAPGQSASDVLVVPIDDFLADKQNKAITVRLTAGDGYTVDTQSSRSSATVQIINDDVAGILVMTSGERILVKENGDTATFQIALLSEPTDDVTITISEKVGVGLSRQLGSSAQAFSYTTTFSRNNWYIPQQIGVESFDDLKIEDGSGETEFTGIHLATLDYSFRSNDTDYNSSSHVGESYHFTNYVQMVDVLDYELSESTATLMQSSLTTLQEGIDSLSLPMVGSLSGKTGQGLRKFITNLTNSIRQIETPTPKKLSRLISREIASALGVPEQAVTVELSMKDVISLNPAVVVRFSFADEYTVFSVPLASDFGMPGLGFQSNGSFDAYFSYSAGLELVFPRSGDVYLNTDTETTFIQANFNASLSDSFSLTGGLGFMQIQAVNQPSVNENVTIGDEPAVTELDVSFELTVSGDAGEDNQLTFAELTSQDLNFEEVFQYSFSGNAAMSFGVTTSVNGSAAIPSFKFELAALLPLFDYSNQEEAKNEENATSFYFDDIRLDLGSYITDMLNPIVDGLDGILKPLYPLVDALYSDTKIFNTLGLSKVFDVDKDGETSTIDLSRWFAGFYATIDPDRGQKLANSVDETIEFLDMLKGVMDLVRDLERLGDEGNFYVSFGSYELTAFSAGDENSDPANEKVDGESAKNLKKDTKDQADQGGKNDDTGESNASFEKIMDQLDELGFTIPLIEDPTNAVKLLFGQDVILFEWEMPGMGMSSNIDKTFPIYGGIEGVIEGGYEVEAHLGFGFDTYGLSQWRDDRFAARDSWKVFNGFYVADLDKNGRDIPEFTMDAGMGAGLGYSARVVRADITGGIESAARLDLLDEGEIAGTSDGRIRGYEITSRISNPLKLFELSGELIAYVKSRVQIGVDLGFYSIWRTVWERRLAEIPIFKFGIGGRYGSGTASNGHLEGATVFFDANFNGRIDSLEPVAITDASGNYNIDVNLRTFDTNRNGKIDLTEGQLIVFGGKDTSMDLPLLMPFVAPLGAMVTPLTTLYSLAVGAGTTPEEAHAIIRAKFGLGDFDFLTTDPLNVLQQAKSFDDPAVKDALAAYMAHFKLHFSWDLVAGVLKQILPNELPSDLFTKLEIIKQISSSLLDKPPGDSMSLDIAESLNNLWSKISPDSAPLVADIASKAQEFAASASNELVSRLDQLRVDVISKGLSPKEFLTAIDTLKKQVFSQYRSNLNGISEGLYRISSPAELISIVEARLKAAHEEFLNKPPTSLNFINTRIALPENTDTSIRNKLADIVIGDDGFGSNIILLSGNDASAFELDGLAIYLKASVKLDFESQQALSVLINVAESNNPSIPLHSQQFTLFVENVREAPKITVPADGFQATEETTGRIVFPDSPFGTGDTSPSKWVTVKLLPSSGLLWAKSANGVTVKTSLRGTTFSGSLENLNRYFTNPAGLIHYRPASDDGNLVHLGITAVERTFKGLLRSSASTTISVKPIQNRPILRVPANFSASAGRSNLFSWSNINSPFGNVDSSILTVTLEIANGRIDASGNSGVKVGGTATARRFTGYASALNAFFRSTNRILYTPANDRISLKMLRTTLSDGERSVTKISVIRVYPDKFTRVI